MFFIGSLFPTFFLDKYGRRNPMMWGSFGLGISMMMISILLSFQSRGGDLAQSTSKGSVAFFFTVGDTYASFVECMSDHFAVYAYFRHDSQLYSLVSPPIFSREGVNHVFGEQISPEFFRKLQ